eukprot:TRINITY_DN5954_c0_g1_i1.p1 TRINITY_DN5954_c0_g1~~TRINITY_DN5954_c0_g1_i1.p1  ORF type:complete len:303 (+),score=67.70 TRINITY_DN5954_c0_g1_i1:208-1116(+)
MLLGITRRIGTSGKRWLSTGTNIAGVKHVVAVSSGKGGVGKSTVAVNLSLGLAKKGLRVGILDADIYGPSIPLLMNLTKYAIRFDPKDGKQTSPMISVDQQSGRLEPLHNHGITCMSMGFLVPSEAPTIWRGMMVTSAVDQLIFKVKWCNLDVLVVDMPPGTGDAALTLSQRVNISGAVIVSTPQDVALADVRKGVNMFKKLSVPIFGLVENMSYFVCPKCTDKHYIFGNGGAKSTAAEMGIEFLGEIPLDQRIRETSDQGKPIIIEDPESVQAVAMMDIAEKVYRQLQAEPSSGQPKISFE